MFPKATLFEGPNAVPSEEKALFELPGLKVEAPRTDPPLFGVVVPPEPAVPAPGVVPPLVTVPESVPVLPPFEGGGVVVPPPPLGEPLGALPPDRVPVTSDAYTVFEEHVTIKARSRNDERIIFLIFWYFIY